MYGTSQGGRQAILANDRISTPVDQLYHLLPCQGVLFIQVQQSLTDEIIVTDGIEIGHHKFHLFPSFAVAKTMQVGTGGLPGNLINAANELTPFGTTITSLRRVKILMHFPGCEAGLPPSKELHIHLWRNRALRASVQGHRQGSP